MAKKALVIVESPSKAKTIQKYLGREYIVKASVGHIKDLPKSKLGVDPKKRFKPDYQIIAAKEKIIAELKEAAKKVPELYLATDPDREGEAIAWHIQEELKGKKRVIHRVLFNSITESAIREAMSHPQKLDERKYHAQQARRILDRLVGYTISPLLWDKVKRGISAGRVQSVALRLVVDREGEIKRFVAEEYWEIQAVFFKDHRLFKSRLFKLDGQDPKLKTRSQVDALLARLAQMRFKVERIEQRERSRRPSAPFITSRLQQDASRQLGYSAKKTMAFAQKLYEGVDLGDLGTHGLITYMRTDSVRSDPQAILDVRTYIERHYGKEYLSGEIQIYKSKKSAQDAHEAIRPASLEFPPERIQHFLDRESYRLYALIWNRFIASQMSPAVSLLTSVDIGDTYAEESQVHHVQFRASGSVLKFAGFTAVYQEERDEVVADHPESTLSFAQIANWKDGDPLALESTEPTQHFTAPPPRFSDASLIKELEERGIGRPSTYASILSNIQDREYVEKRENRYYPSELGTVVTELLVGSFPEILNSEFTAAMETQLDDIAEGNAEWVKTLRAFWTPFEKTLLAAKIHMKDLKRQEVPTTLSCEKCQHFYVIRWGKLGSFLACSNYPNCRNTQDFTKDELGSLVIVPKVYTDKNCIHCAAPMIIKSGKFGKFLACSDYPNCKYTLPITIGVDCPICEEGEIAEKQSRFRRLFYSCNQWPKCSFSCWEKPMVATCPECQFPIMVEKITKKYGLSRKCPNKECNYTEVIDPNYGKPGEETLTPTAAEAQAGE